MGKLLIIGCGGVASVAIHKCCQNSAVFEDICIASRKTPAGRRVGVALTNKMQRETTPLTRSGVELVAGLKI